MRFSPDNPLQGTKVTVSLKPACFKNELNFSTISSNLSLDQSTVSSLFMTTASCETPGGENTHTHGKKLLLTVDPYAICLYEDRNAVITLTFPLFLDNEISMERLRAERSKKNTANLKKSRFSQWKLTYRENEGAKHVLGFALRCRNPTRILLSLHQRPKVQRRPELHPWSCWV